MKYLSNERYTDTKEPSMDGSFRVEFAVPAYFEDMQEIFRAAGIENDIAINPLYEVQTYPQTGYVNDMALPNYLGSFGYKKTFSLTEISPDTEIRFGGVQNTVLVWINGKYIGMHEGYSSEFSMKIPAEILKIGENTVTLAVSNHRLAGYESRPVSGLTSRAACECTGGIYGDVEICSYFGGVRDVWVSTQKDLSSFTVKFNATEEKERTLTVLDGEKELARVKIPSGKSEIQLSSGGYEFWSPDNPKLYVAKISDCDGNVAEHRFGIRRLTSRGTRLYLNGEPYFFRGFCEHCYHPITVHPTRDKNYYAKVIKTAKNLGFNSIRFHTYVPPVEYMQAADELGILIEVETPNNTTYTEWLEIINMARKYTSAVMYSSGNEMVIDEDYIAHLKKISEYVHAESDSLFSPMSAMRGIEYFSYGDCQVEEPFTHNPKRLAALSEFCDAYNTYSLGLTSYTSATGDSNTLDTRNAIYKKPLLSHEICIHGTYCDLSLKGRYEGSRIGKTELFTSVERHLKDVGILDRAELYYKNSVRWQMELRKMCFELVRLSDTFAGYDFLGDIDTHWHTFGYCVGMMNEFYELKPGESVENVRRYNSDAVLLCKLGQSVNYRTGEEISLPILVSNYGNRAANATLKISLTDGACEIFSKKIDISEIESGKITELYRIKMQLPSFDSPTKIDVTAKLCGDGIYAENEWQIYAFPAPCDSEKYVYQFTEASEMDEDELLERLSRGERVLIFGAKPFQYEATDFQISLAGRTNGHLATVINKHPLTDKIPHEHFLGRQFQKLLTGGRAAVLDSETVTYEPIIEIATAYKNAHKEALLFEYTVGKGKLLVCGLNFTEGDPLSEWLRAEIRNYVGSDSFIPKISVTEAEICAMIDRTVMRSEQNTNLAMNKNDITAN